MTWAAHNAAVKRASLAAAGVSAAWDDWAAAPTPARRATLQAKLHAYDEAEHTAGVERVRAEADTPEPDPAWVTFHDAREAARAALVADPHDCPQAAAEALAAAGACEAAEREAQRGGVLVRSLRRAAASAREAALLAEQRKGYPGLDATDPRPDPKREALRAAEAALTSARAAVRACEEALAALRGAP